MYIYLPEGTLKPRVSCMKNPILFAVAFDTFLKKNEGTLAVRLYDGIRGGYYTQTPAAAIINCTVE